jgi:hypothetical protein
MIKFNLSEDNQWLILAQCTDEVEKKQVELSLTKKIHNWYFHPLVKKKIWDGSINFIDKRGPFWKIPVGLWSEVLDSRLGLMNSLQIVILNQETTR